MANTKPNQKDQYSNQTASSQKNTPGGSRAGNNIEKDEPNAQERGQGGMKNEGKELGSRTSSSIDDKNPQALSKCLNA